MPKMLSSDRTGKTVEAVNIPSQERSGSLAFRFTIDRRKLINGTEAAIRGKISYMGQSTGPFSLGISARYDAINTKRLLVKGEPDKTALLADLKARAGRSFADQRAAGKPVDVFAIKKALFAVDATHAQLPNVRQLVDCWIAYDNKRFIAGEIVQRTLWKNTRWTNDFWAYVVQEYGKQARLSDLKPADIRRFVLWLRQEPRNLCNNVAQSTAAHAKVVMNFALDNEWVDRNVFANFRRSMDPVERVTLSEEEIRTFCTFPLATPALEMVRDIFFFMCLSGLSYADTERLIREHIKEEKDGTKYIYVIRRKMISRKSRVPATIPLTAPALAILAKYEPYRVGEQLLPIQANAPFNRCLKQIAFMCGLEKSVSTKVARNSLATYLINQSVPLQSISAILGHSSVLTTTSFYAKIQPKQVINDLGELHKRLDGNGLFGINSLPTTAPVADNQQDISESPTGY